MISHPVEHACVSDPDDVDEVRRLDCVSYNPCLWQASARGWKGFACTSCRAYRPLTTEQKRNDFAGMTELLLALNLCPGGRRWYPAAREPDDYMQMNRQLRDRFRELAWTAGEAIWRRKAR